MADGLLVSGTVSQAVHRSVHQEIGLRNLTFVQITALERVSVCGFGAASPLSLGVFFSLSTNQIHPEYPEIEGGPWD